MAYDAACHPSPFVHGSKTGANTEGIQKKINHNDADTKPDRKLDFARLIQMIILECGDPARVLELYYWSQQPGLREAVRVLAALPEQKRATIQTFLAMVQDPAAIAVAMGVSGELALYSPEVAANLDAFRKALTTQRSAA